MCGEGSDFGCNSGEGGSSVMLNCQLGMLRMSQEIVGTQVYFLRPAWHPHQRILHCCGCRPRQTGTGAGPGGTPAALGMLLRVSEGETSGAPKHLGSGTDPGGLGPLRVTLPWPLHTPHSRAGVSGLGARGSQRCLLSLMRKVTASPRKCPV